jgi:hypothetical protein
MYIGLSSRLEGFERGALTGALERRAVIQATLMRITIHLVSRRDFWPLALATREARRALWLRTRPEPVSAPARMAMRGPIGRRGPASKPAGGRAQASLSTCSASVRR